MLSQEVSKSANSTVVKRLTAQMPTEVYCRGCRGWYGAKLVLRSDQSLQAACVKCGSEDLVTAARYKD